MSVINMLKGEGQNFIKMYIQMIKRKAIMTGVGLLLFIVLMSSIFGGGDDASASSGETNTEGMQGTSGETSGGTTGGTADGTPGGTTDGDNSGTSHRSPEDSIDYLVLVDYNNSNDNIPSSSTVINKDVIENKFNRRRRT